MHPGCARGRSNWRPICSVHGAKIRLRYSKRRVHKGYTEMSGFTNRMKAKQKNLVGAVGIEFSVHSISPADSVALVPTASPKKQPKAPVLWPRCGHSPKVSPTAETRTRDLLHDRVIWAKSKLWPAFLFCDLQNPLSVKSRGFCCQVAAKFFFVGASMRAGLGLLP